MLILVDVTGVHGVEPPEIDEFARRIDFRLMHRFGLVQHGGGVDFRTPWSRKQLAGLEKDRSACCPGHGGPRGVGRHRGIDAALDFGFAGQMHPGQDVGVVVRHHLLNDVPGPHLFTVDDAWNLEHLSALTRQFCFK